MLQLKQQHLQEEEIQERNQMTHIFKKHSQ
jgi:hypothetical protein